MKERLLLIDGFNLAFRSFYAIPDTLETSSNLPVNALYGFLRTLISLLENVQPTMTAVCLDAPGQTFRAKKDPHYKAHRKETPPSLAVQLKMLQDDLLPTLEIPFYSLEGWEADDLIATFCDRFDQLTDIFIVSNDADLFQLLEYNNVGILSSEKTNAFPYAYRREEFIKEFGFNPSRYLLYKSLTGDTSDNINGIKGLGPKTASKLIQQFTTMECLLSDDSKATEPVRREEQKVRHNLSLIELSKDLPLKINQEDLKFSTIAYDALSKVANTYEFHSFLHKYFSAEPSKSSATGIKDLDKEMPSHEEIRHLLLQKTWSMVYDEETTELSAFCPDEGGCRTFLKSNSFSQREGGLLFQEDSLLQSSPMDLMRNIINSASFLKTYNAKKLFHALNLEADGPKCKIEDLQMMFYLLYPNLKSYSLHDFLLRFAPQEASFHAKALWDLPHQLKRLLSEQNLDKVYDELEIPLIKVLYAMERQGIKISRHQLKKLEKELKEELKRIETDIFQLIGSTFNLASPKQLAFVLFEKLNLPPLKKTKTGYSTNAEVLEALEPLHPAIAMIKQHREISKLLNTYVEAFSEKIDQNDLLHTTFLQAGPATGRISSIDPNLQNLPSESHGSVSLKSLIIPSQNDWILVSADYSQIDLRVMAHFSGDPFLRDAFLREEDIHCQTARKIFHLSQTEEVSLQQRKLAKAINFGIIYGMSSYGLSRSLKISEAEASNMIERYFNEFSRVRDFRNETIIKAKEHGFVETLIRRKRPIPEIRSNNKQLQQLGERLAVNTIIQGSSADIIKMAMTKMHDQLSSQKEASLLLQIHDELVWECSPARLPFLNQLAIDEMEHAIALNVPLKVHVRKGHNLADLLPYVA